MTRRRYTTEEKLQALALAAQHGPAEASRRTGIKEGTIRCWRKRAQKDAPVLASEPRSTPVASPQTAATQGGKSVATGCVGEPSASSTSSVAAQRDVATVATASSVVGEVQEGTWRPAAFDLLPEKYQIFVLHYADQGFKNAAEAARSAGFASGKKQGHRLLKRAEIKAAIAEMQDKVLQRMPLNEVLAQIEEATSVSAEDFYSVDGAGKLQLDMRKAYEEGKMKYLKGVTMDDAGGIKSFTLHSNVQASAKLAELNLKIEELKLKNRRLELQLAESARKNNPQKEEGTATNGDNLHSRTSMVASVVAELEEADILCDEEAM